MSHAKRLRALGYVADAATNLDAPRPGHLGWLWMLLALYACWIGMEVLHELGHVLNAWTSGGNVVTVVLPPLGFSQTIVEPNPDPRFVAWGGAMWGSWIPLVACGMALLVRRRVPEPLKFFAGFCLIVNGLYLVIGWLLRAGDAGDLIRMNASPIALLLFGVACTFFGAALWHQLKWLTLRSHGADAA